MAEVKVGTAHAAAGGDRHAHAHCGHAAHDPGTNRVKDPVCGMSVDPHTTAHRARHGGMPYFFCSAGCRAKFTAEPGRYVGSEQEPKTEAVPEGAIYTCPMHPQIRQVGPDSCPICGMALEPVLVSTRSPARTPN